ncbi:SMI1/KNR4 family protein [Streptomyces sp. NPDC001652]|uniref:SMI1/KNR4 family protein n=1 Tax=Streptomyces sp. NPDC001652 TaxID=3154393 RepID=UPI00331D8ECD
MSERSLSSAWLSSWASAVSGLLGEMTEEFESKHGFPPGTNQIRLADHGDQEAVRVLGSDARASADLVTFYGSIGEVSWEDVGNGYFVHPARDVLERAAVYGAVRMGERQEPCGLVIGSDGGGLSYVVGPEGSVHRTRAATLDDAELDTVADDLRHFLELLERSLARFVATGEPGYL